MAVAIDIIAQTAGVVIKNDNDVAFGRIASPSIM